jgi:hypothetical protein
MDYVYYDYDSTFFRRREDTVAISDVWSERQQAWVKFHGRRDTPDGIPDLYYPIADGMQITPEELPAAARSKR